MQMPRVDYVIAGHFSQDQTPDGGWHLGGTAAYAALTARAFGLRVGVVTAATADLPLDRLDGVFVQRVESADNTVFENMETPQGRRQVLHRRAAALTWAHIPARWRHVPWLHLAPIVDELPHTWDENLSPGFLGATLQGWLRAWDARGQVHPAFPADELPVLDHLGAAVISIEDVRGDEILIDELVLRIPVLAVTEAAEGARLYWRGDVRRFRAPRVQQVDATGAGDIFSAAFFIRLRQTRDPWEAARFAVHLASLSVTRRGLDSVPTRQEIQQSLVEVI